MNEDKKIWKAGARLSFFIMLLLCIGAAIFFRERLFADTSYYVYNIIRTESFCIQHSRYGAFITQLIPVLFVKLHLPLRAILIGYVVNFNLFFLAVSFLLTFVLRQYRLAILLSLYYVLMVSDSYFWANDEIHHAVAWMFLFFGFAVVFNGRGIARILEIFLLSVLVFFAFTAHFIVLIPLFFLFVFFFLDEQTVYFSRQQLAGLVCAVVCGIAAKFLLSPPASAYEQQHLHGVTHVSFSDIFSSFTTPVVKKFAENCIVNYWTAVIVFSAGIVLLFRDGKKPLVIWCIAGAIGYMVLMGLTYRDLDENVRLFHIETEWQCISIIFAVPFVFSVLPGLSGKYIVLALSLIFTIRIAYIASAWPKFHWRIAFHEHVLEKMRQKGITKLAMPRTKEICDRYILEWTMPYESMYASALDGDKPQLTFVLIDTADKPLIAELSDPDKIFLFAPGSVTELNHNYFNLDTTHSYRIMSYEELNK